MSRKGTACFLAIMAAALPVLARDDAASGLRPLLQRQLDALVASSGIPGATLAVRLPGGKSICLASGFADAEKRRPMSPGDRMLSGSIGKTFVAAVVLQLEEEGWLRIEDPLARYFPGEEWLRSLANGAQVSLRMLLSHTGGLPEYVEDPRLWADVKRWPDKVWTPRERLAYILGTPPRHAAGCGWSYADTNYILLGMVIEKVTGNSYYRELARRILRPARLAHTTPAVGRKLPGMVPGYSRLDEPFAIQGRVLDAGGRYLFDPQLEWTGGGLISNSADLAAWAAYLFEGRAFSGAQLGKMLARVKATAEWDYGLGAIIRDAGHGTSFGHAGFAPGYSSIMEYVPAGRFAIALQFNCDYVSLAAGKTRHEIASGFIASISAFLKFGAAANKEP